MRFRKAIILMPLLLIALTLTLQANAETVFVQPVKAAMKAEPKMTAADVQALARGDELEVVSTQGVWLEVKRAGKTGWVSKLFVNKNKPIGAASLAEEAPASEAKTSRRREASYAVSASTRGLMPVQRTRDGREEYRTNNQALDSMERLAIEPKELQRFRDEAKLPE